jgi:hypothetical protein
MIKLSRFLSALIIILLFSSSFACEKTANSNEENLCFYFDQRQCAGDDWAEIISNNTTWKEREEAMQSYLENQNIEVKDFYIEPLFHEAVCEACYVCPEQHRFFIKTEAENKTNLEALDLLNFGEGDCADLFN